MAKKTPLIEPQLDNPYECLTESKSSIGGMRNNSVNRFLPVVKERSISSEGIDWETDKDIRSGTIVFSTDINATRLHDNMFISSIKQRIAAIDNRADATKMVDPAPNAHSPVGWTVGHNYGGRYKAKNGKSFSENSTTLDIIGVSSDDLVSVATDLCLSFPQETILLKLTSGKVLYIEHS